MLDLAAAALAGLLGSAHCVGMCGGFVALLGLGDGRAVARRQTAYFAGKTLTYSAFGALAGAAGFALREPLAGLGGVLAVGLGVGMVVAGLAVCGVWPRRAGASTMGARFGPVIGRLVASERRGALVALGAVNGLLPCGLVYGMLAIAASSGSAGRGALTMAVFGLATVPALAATGWLSGLLRPGGRARLQRLAGVVVVAMGLLTVARGAQALTPAPPSAEAAVCVVPAR